ncbi:MAG: hypothetical protein M3Y70_09675 [Pseudomonadota bacterium]|nr:hypothetical protein [Pseudomonadota bacterium]
MNGSRQVVGTVATGIGTNGAKRSRAPKIAPVTRAVRAALAVSAAAIALAGSGVAFAGDCTAPVDNVVHCNGDFTDTISFAVEDLTLVVGDESPSTVMPGPGEFGILADWAGSIGVSNLADISVYGSGDVIGVYAYSDGGDVTIDNGGSIEAYSSGALADGIFASGGNVDVANSETGSIYAAGATWAAGIEAQGDDLTTVVNDGAIDAIAFAGGYAFGIYATAGDGGSASVSNSGDITANGFYSSGIYVQSGGDAHADNSGSITAGSLNYAISGTGIHVSTSALDGVAVGENNGDIVAQGYYGAAGVEALATSPGGSASASNSGTIYAGQYAKYYGSGAVGLVASADGDASVDNSGGIETYSGGMAYGAMALAFNGSASATNSGDIAVESAALGTYGAYGLVAASQNGVVTAGNDGSIVVQAALNSGMGIQASSMAGTSVANNGSIDVNAKYGYGVFATAGEGDAAVSNSADGVIGVYSGLGYATGIFVASSLGDVAVDNAGSISTNGYSQSVGIFARPDQGSVSIDNSGVIYAYAYAGVAAGIYANSAYASIDVTSDGAIDVIASNAAFGILGSAVEATISNGGEINATGYAAATGIDAFGEDLVTVDNSGSITAIAYGDARGINATSVDGDVHVDNSGSILAGSLLLDAIGVYGYSTTGDVSIHNDGAIVAVSPDGLADGIFASGVGVEVSNGAEGDISAYGYSWTAGIEAQGSDSVVVSNDGSIYTRTYGVSEAFGIYAGGGAGGASVDNSGSISVHGYDSAVGIYAQAGGPIDIANSGDVLAGYITVVDGGGVYSSSYASAILALSGTDGAAISIENSGSATAASFSGSNGIEARSLGVGGTVGITNSGEVNAYALSQFGGVATGIAASAAGDAWIDNAGMVYAYSASTAYGAVALSFNGDASVVNSGDIGTVSTAFDGYSAFGAVAASTNGSASVDNSGTIEVYTPYIGAGIEVGGMQGASIVNSGDVAVDAWVAYGVRASSGLGDVAVDNSGSIAASYSGTFPGYSWGIHTGTVGGDIAIDNSGEVSSDGGRQSLAIFASTTSGDISVDSSGSIASNSYTGLSAAIFATNTGGDVSVHSSGSLEASTYIGTSAGAFARASQGIASIANSGDIASTSTYGTAYGALARGMYVNATNSGDIAAEGYGSAYGVYLDGVYDASLASSGGIEAVAVGNAFGAYVSSFYGEAGVTNSGDITVNATYGLAVGVLANGYHGAVVGNSGTIGAEAGPSGTAVGVYARAYGDVVVQNSGTISATHDVAAIAVQLESLYGTATLENSGTIETHTSVAGSIALVGSNGANEIHNTGDIHGAIVTFDADDSFANGSGGTWLVGNGTTYFGGGDDSIDNDAGGTIHLAGGAIYLGASGAAGNAFHNAGTIRASGYGLIDMGAGAMALDNGGVISFVDGATDDLLVINGDLGGDGAINLDISLLNGTADLLYVDGDVVDGTTQAVNLAIDSLDGVLAGGSAQVVAVSGTVAANTFTGGQVLNVDPSNFLDLAVVVSSDGAGLFSASVGVAGLNDAGVLAGSVANGAHSLINSSIGTRNQRLGLAPVLADGDVGLGPWIRVFSDDGDVAPDASGFGSDRDFGFSQENRGTEFGMNLSLGNGISLGVMGGNAEGTQKLTGAQGGDEIDLNTSGLYASWAGAHFYADASMRWMDFDARLMSIGGEQRTSGNATAFNLEGGYTGWTFGGFNIVPQAQYTRSVIDNVDVVEGTQTGLAIYGGVSERARVGVAVDRSFVGGMGITWTPFGALSAVREMDGNTGFTVADSFDGRASTSGNSTLAEIGVGLQRGRVSATVGANWADGGALDGFTGGQLVLRYTW